ncbi:cobalt-precorrin-6A reductase [Terasakiella sp. SH-1]|uniref:cobalt-precorrin-6A reductase n=1 Tax=Terasakiella sp. SH-1 TaxID=2560057 RepID=UPI001073C7BC|nr:cobalt-precorrin-6A reductase [Terasakiella sp. SH-1]
MSAKKLLILGGTGDGAAFARRAHAHYGDRVEIIISYSGITGHQPDLPCAVRVGGFGGMGGLIDYIKAESITHMVDATHPYAEKISHHAYGAAFETETPLAVLWREEWRADLKDRWLDVDDMDAAVRAVEQFGRKTLITTGIKDVSAFAELDEDISLVVRLVNEPKEDLALNNYEMVISRPPYDVEKERQLIRDYHIQVMVSKNSGGAATYAKIEAARAEGIGVIMIKRPPLEPLDYISEPDEMLEWLTVHGL